MLMGHKLRLAIFASSLLVLACAAKPTVVMDVSGLAKTGAITGRITDGNWHPMAGAYVRLEGPALGGDYRYAFSDEAGRYYISDIPPGGDYILYVKAGNRPRVSKTHLNVKAGALINVSFDISTHGVLIK
jgi:protocatechuate 3,4-dioxygenase beta subunit